MDDTTIITDADYGVLAGSGGTAPTGVVTISVGSSWGGGAMQVPTAWLRTRINANGTMLCVEEVPPKPEVTPKKPPPSLPVEAWATRQFDAESAHAATLALCRGQ